MRDSTTDCIYLAGAATRQESANRVSPPGVWAMSSIVWSNPIAVKETVCVPSFRSVIGSTLGTAPVRTVDALRVAHYTMPFPDQGPEKIARRGILSRSAVTTPACSLVLLLPVNTTLN